MKTLTRVLAIAALGLAVPAASGEAPRTIEVTPPEAAAAAPAPPQPAREAEAAVVVDPTADAQPLGFTPWGPGGGDDQLGTCTIYCDGQPRPYQMTYDECCGGPHLCPNGQFSEPNTYWSPNFGDPVLCMY